MAGGATERIGTTALLHPLLLLGWPYKKITLSRSTSNIHFPEYHPGKADFMIIERWQVP